jgi:hypothetical protein
MIEIPLFEVIPRILLSPYVIGVTLFIIVYGSILSRVARPGARTHKILPKKPVKIKKPAPEKPGLSKKEDISDLGLD